jgi:arsenite-transporting ATPase
VRLVLYTGKGGVGKTTTAAAAAVSAAERGRRTLVASADAAHSLGDVLERRLGPAPIAVAPGLDAVEIDARVETARHWGRIQEYLVSMLLYQGIEEVVAEELAQLPGAEELMTLLAVERHAREGGYDGIVLDCAPSDATLRLTTLPDVTHGMLRVVLPLLRSLSGLAVPVARRLIGLPLPEAGVFADAERLLYRNLAALRRRLVAATTSVRIVVTPERMVIDEARRTYTELALFEVPCDAVVMNRLLPREAGSESFFRDWIPLQDERCREATELFAPLPVLHAPLQDDEITGVERLAAHGQRLFASCEPDAVLCRSPRVRFAREGADYVAVVPLPGAASDALDVTKIEDELIVTTPARRRALKLPRRMASLHLSAARLEGGSLLAHFTRAPAEEVRG